MNSSRMRNSVKALKTTVRWLFYEDMFYKAHAKHGTQIQLGKVWEEKYEKSFLMGYIWFDLTYEDEVRM